MTGMERASTEADWNGSNTTKRDNTNCEARRIANDAADMNRAYRTVTREQAEMIWSAIDSLMELVSRKNV